MRILPLIAATLLAAGAAEAQLYGTGCSGDTMSELARCIAERAPPLPSEAETEQDTLDAEADLSLPGAGMGVAPSAGVIRAPGLGPARLGGALSPGGAAGALRPANLRATSPSADRSARAARAPRGSRIRMENVGTIRDPNSPLYGLGRGIGGSIGTSRYDPLSGTGVGTFGIRR